MRDLSSLGVYYAIGMLVEAKERHCGDKKECRGCELYINCNNLNSKWGELQGEVLHMTAMITARGEEREHEKEKGKKNG